MYYEDEYEQRCVVVKGPPECAEYQAALLEAKRQTELANRIYAVGDLPKAEVKSLNEAINRLERLP